MQLKRYLTSMFLSTTSSCCQCIEQYRGLCQVYLGNVPEGVEIMQDALEEKVTAEHEFFRDAIIDRGEGYFVFSIVGDSFRIHSLTFHSMTARRRSFPPNIL